MELGMISIVLCFKQYLYLPNIQRFVF